MEESNRRSKEFRGTKMVRKKNVFGENIVWEGNRGRASRKVSGKRKRGAKEGGGRITCDDREKSRGKKNFRHQGKGSLSKDK